MSKAGNCDLPPDDVETLGVTWETSTFSTSPLTFVLFIPHTLYRTFFSPSVFSATRSSNDSVSHFFVICINIHTLRLSWLPPVLRLPEAPSHRQHDFQGSTKQYSCFQQRLLVEFPQGECALAHYCYDVFAPGAKLVKTLSQHKWHVASPCSSDVNPLFRTPWS